MINIIYIVTDQILQSTDWPMTQRLIDQIQNEIQFYKNLSFKVLNVDNTATTRNDPQTTGVNKYPWLRAHEDGKIIDNWQIKRLELTHWETWYRKYGIKYTLDELDEIRKSDELRRLEEERKRIEAANNEQKILNQTSGNSKISTGLLIGAGALLLLLLRK